MGHFRGDCPIYCFCAKNRTITFSLLIRPCFLAFYTHHQLPANPISHQLSRRECFYLLVIKYFNTDYSSTILERPVDAHKKIYMYVVRVTRIQDLEIYLQNAYDSLPGLLTA